MSSFTRNHASNPPFLRIALPCLLGVGAFFLAIDIVLTRQGLIAAGTAQQTVLNYSLLLAFLGVVAIVYARFLSIARRALDSSLQHAENIRKALDVAWFTFSVDAHGTAGTLQECSAVAASLLGYSQAELCQRTPADLLPADRQADLARLLNEITANGVCRFETQVLTNDGQILPVQWAARRDDRGLIHSCLFDIRDAVRADASLQETRAVLNAMTGAVPLAVISLDTAGLVTNWNGEAEELFGWREYEVFGQPLPWIPEEQQPVFQSWMEHVLANEPVHEVTMYCRRHDDSPLEITLSLTPVFQSRDGVTGVMLVAGDMMGNKERVMELQRANQGLMLLDEIKRAMFRASSEEELLRGVCVTLTQAAGYTLAWVGFLRGDRLQKIEPSVWAGGHIPSFRNLSITCVGSKPTSDPVVTAIATGTPAIAAHLATGVQSIPWLADAVSIGAGSVIAVPLFAGVRASGVLVIYAAQAMAFQQAEIDLLTELADDMSFGLDAIRTREAHERSQEDLLRSARQWRSTFDAISDPICVLDLQGIIQRCNQAFAEFVGKDFDAVIGINGNMILHGTETMPEHCALSSLLATGQAITETVSRGDRWFQVSVNPITDDQGVLQGAIHIQHDITERRNAVEDLQRNYRRLQGIINETIAAIAKIAEMRDPYTAGHERRVCHLALAIGREMGLSEDRLEGLRVGGMLHDIGKLYVPAEMLSKSGALSEVEFSVIKAHTQAGYEILRTIDFPWPVAEMVVQHHERMDGTGYPNGLSGENILLEARILAVADVVESMASHRPYRPSRGLDAALQEVLDHAGVRFDRAVVEACVRLFHEQGYTIVP